MRQTDRWQRRVMTGAALLLVAGGLSCGEQPAPFCTISRATYAARYDLVAGEGACAKVRGEVLGGQAYVPDPDKPGDFGSLAIQSEELGQRVFDGEAADPPVLDADEEHKSYSYGYFRSRTPDKDNVCTVPKLSDAELDQGPVKTAKAMLPAFHRKYHWGNVRSYVTPAQIGVLWAGDLTYTEGACTAYYRVVAISPKVSCADENGQPDPHLCVAEPDPASGFAGSGLSPDIEVECDPILKLCVPAGKFPSLKGTH